jgi:cephalosporin hydroxylase
LRPVKDIAKKLLPETAVEAVQRRLARRAARLETRTKPIDLSYVELIREAPFERLSDPSYLEHELLPALGLNDEMLHQVPERLHRATGHGLLHWQMPNQFSKYLVELSRHRIESYLEIGSRHGGTFVITVEYLSRFHPVRRAVAVDLGRSRTLERYAQDRDGVTVLQADSQSHEFRSVVESHGGFDLVLIDGDHSEEGCRSDFELVRDRARIIALHDIVGYDVPGVRTVWREVRTGHYGRFTFAEFTDQYPEIERRGVTDFGLGVAFRRRAALLASPMYEVLEPALVAAPLM